MRYLLLIGSTPETDALPEEPGGMPIEQWVDEMDGRGVRVEGDRLRPAEDATSVRIIGGETVVTDGPFVEGKDYIAGFDLLECVDLDEAIEVASKHPMARGGFIEIRPIWAFD
jgi:hypothetical protein